MEEKELHCEHCHIGSCPGCRIGAVGKGSMRKIFRIIDSYVEAKELKMLKSDDVKDGFIHFTENNFIGDDHASILRRCIQDIRK